GSYRLRIFDRPPAHDRRRTGRLISQHYRPALSGLLDSVTTHTWRLSQGTGVRAGRLRVADPMRGDIAGVADRERVVVGHVAERFYHFERDRLLSLYAIRVDGIDDVDGQRSPDLLHQAHAVVEVAPDLQHYRAMHHRLRELAERDLAFRYQHEAGHAPACGVGGGRSRRVAGRGADDRSRAFFPPPRDSHRHAAALERAGGVQTLELGQDAHALAHEPRQVLELDEWCCTLVERDCARLCRYRQAVAILVDQSGIHRFK